MKKAICMIMVMIALLGTMGCATDDDSGVRLTKRNVEDYLTIETEQGKLQKQSVGNYVGYYIEVTVSLKPLVEAKYSGVKITLELMAVSDKKLTSKEVILDIPESGEYSETFKLLMQSGVSVSPDAYVFHEKLVTDVTGTVILG